MAIRIRNNQYQGINAHLHSYLQNEPAGWEEFHGVHITHLAEAIDRLLPPGYIVRPEKSMQIREFHPDSGEPVMATRKRRPQPDLSILQTTVSGDTQSGNSTISTPTRLLSAQKVLDDDPTVYLMALTIHTLSRDNDPGKPVTWIELLSPTNKPGGSGALQYREKRAAALRGGLALVEIDYLHEYPPVIALLPAYPVDEGAFPYIILVTNPQPSLAEGEAHIYEIGIDMPLPIIKIPLSGTQFIALDCGAVYNHTFSSLSTFSYHVDYAVNPVNFERYQAADQEKIQARMAVVSKNSSENPT